MQMDDFLFRGDLHSLDPDVAALIDLEAIRQARKLVMIPSESTIPQAVREAVGSVLMNIYAEGYPPESWRFMPEHDLLDTDVRLAEFRRYGDPRYYKGTEVADIVESLARRRTAERFANDRAGANELYVNVQPLSGAPANSAVYTALAKPGDTIMGLDLISGGHLTHGSPVNRSGLFFNVIPYGLDDKECIDYDQVRDLAHAHKPKFIIGGYTSYPWAPDWHILREIADETGSYLLADVSHVAGLIIADQYPSPIGIADIVSFTTHKTIGGPRGAVLITHRKDLYRKIDRAVFPGEQGGPHVNSIAALAVAMKLASTQQFHDLQRQTVINAQIMAEHFENRGIRVPYGGTNTHMLLIDTGQIKGEDGSPLSGDIAARLLDIAGVVSNRNTIPGDKSPFRATGVRFGTPWITQRGFRENDIIKLTDAIADLLLACKPFSYRKRDWRAKVPFETFVDVQRRLAKLAVTAGIDYEIPTLLQYPKEADAAEEHFRILPQDDNYHDNWQTLHIYGESATSFLDAVLTSKPAELSGGDWQATFILDANGVYITRGLLEKANDEVYLLHIEENVDLVLQWLTALSDGFVEFDLSDLHAKVPGPVSVSPYTSVPNLNRFDFAVDFDRDWFAEGIGIAPRKSYFVGCYSKGYKGVTAKALPNFEWSEPEREALLTTPLYSLHKELGAKTVPYAGYDMPVWYASVSEEHRAVRTAAGIFDVAHMGVFEISGQRGEDFLNAVATNDVSTLDVGQAHYSYFLDTHGVPLDDVFIYRLAHQRFLAVVNAANNDKVWAWLNAVKDGTVRIDEERPWSQAPGRETVTLRDLRATESGDDRRVDIALQGPESLNQLLALEGSDEDKDKLKHLQWAEIINVTLAGYDLFISRTGYTGERVAYEIFVHPEQAASFFKMLVDNGVIPCGLAARDSLRIEAGLPLYGHELAGPLNMNPGDAGFANFVKTWKPFFIGKRPYLKHEIQRDSEVIRFGINDRGLRAPVEGDPVVDSRGRVIGQVCSCAVDADGQHIGLALVKDKYTTENTPLLIYANAHSTRGNVAVSEVNIGDKLLAPQAATVLSRFPKKRKKK